jgi:hypothetical protein
MKSSTNVDDKTIEELKGKEGDQSMSQAKKLTTQDQVDHGAFNYCNRTKDSRQFQELGLQDREPSMQMLNQMFKCSYGGAILMNLWSRELDYGAWNPIEQLSLQLELV